MDIKKNLKIHIWSHQGSFSTLMLRSFYSAGFTVGNEPFIVGEEPHNVDVQHTGLFGANQDIFLPKWKSIVRKFEQHEQVVLKEHAWVFQNLPPSEDVQELTMHESKHIFLLRRPDLAFSSYVRRLTGHSQEEISGMLRETEMSLSGFQTLWNAFPRNTKLLINGGSLMENPETNFRKVLSWISPDLASHKEFFEWSPRDNIDPIFGGYEEFQTVRRSTGWNIRREEAKLVLFDNPAHAHIVAQNMDIFRELSCVCDI